MATLMDRVRDDEDRQLKDAAEQFPIPNQVKSRTDRGRMRMRDGASERNEIMHFWRGNQYVYRSPKGYLLQQDTITDPRTGSGKPPHRMRTVRNMILDVVAREVSAATSRVPSFEVDPSTTDPEDITAAKLAEKVALYGYDKWNLRDVAVRAVTYAVLTGEAFAWPYFDNTVGPFIRSDDGKVLTGIGEVKVRVFGGNQVMWEPGVKFDESRWFAVDVAMPCDEVKEIEGFLGGPVKADAQSDAYLNSGPDKPSDTDQVIVTHYLERPNPKFPSGRWVTVANNRTIAGVQKAQKRGESDVFRPYPCRNGEGKIVDEPVLHKLSYFTDPDNDRDWGLGKALLDPQRTLNDCTNKLLEWKNLAPIGQVFVSPGLMKGQRLTDAPGAIYEIPQPEQNVKFRPIPDLPQAIFQIRDQALEDIARISAQNDIPAQVESGKGIEALLESDRSRKGTFLQGLAEWWSHLQRHNLYLVQQHYSDQDGRLLKIQGRRGPELIVGFKGADLNGNADVRVSTASIEPRTKEAVEQRVMTFANLGWITPEVAMSAINGGTAEKLVESYELDVARANRIIRLIMTGPEALFALGGDTPPEPPPASAMAPAPSPLGGSPAPDAAVPVQPPEKPGWMPREFDNTRVHKAIFTDWMKTVEYEELEPGMKESADLYYKALLQLEADEAARAAEAQAATAEQYGAQNAAKPGAKPNPSFPKLDQPDSGSTSVPPPQS
jgi:hypothetical protein